MKEVYCLDNKTGDVYYKKESGGLWRNKEQLIAGSKDYQVNIENYGIFISTKKIVNDESDDSYNHNINIYEMKTHIVKISTIPRLVCKYLNDIRWAPFKQLNIIAILLFQEDNSLILNLYATHKKFDSILFKSIEIENKVSRLYGNDLKLMLRRNTLEVVCKYGFL